MDLFLTRLLACSRASVQKRIKEGMVRLNGKAAVPHAPVSAGDTLEIAPAALIPEEKPPLPLRILFENDDVMAVDKPAGLLVHGTKGKREPSLADALVRHDPSIAKAGEDPSRPGIVHRLDKLASGVLVIAKTPEAYLSLKRQFMERRTRKEYLVLVYGRLPKDTGTIRLSLARSKRLGRMVARPEGGDGKEAVTHYEVLARFKTATLIRARIETGRTHQIRAHFRAIDHPVVGDPLYRKMHMKNIHSIPLLRLFLHAERLTVELLGGETKTFETPLPPELQAVLEALPKR